MKTKKLAILLFIVLSLSCVSLVGSASARTTHTYNFSGVEALPTGWINATSADADIQYSTYTTAIIPTGKAGTNAIYIDENETFSNIQVVCTFNTGTGFNAFEIKSNGAETVVIRIDKAGFYVLVNDVVTDTEAFSFGDNLETFNISLASNLATKVNMTATGATEANVSLDLPHTASTDFTNYRIQFYQARTTSPADDCSNIIRTVTFVGQPTVEDRINLVIPVIMTVVIIGLIAGLAKKVGA